MAPTSRPRVGCTATSSCGSLIDLAGDDGLLLVAAGHAAGDGGRALAAAHIVLLDQALGVLEDGVLLDEAVVLELRLPVTLQHHVVARV